MQDVAADLRDVVTSPEETPRRLPFRFTGEAGEYFRIWIVNVLLSILTLGIYSAWAKVRTKHYFYRHTWVGESCFDYHGDPVLILKGRLIIGGFFVLLFLSQAYSLVLYGLLFAVLFVFSPWIAVKAISFNARNSSYRNVRFSFHGDLGTAFRIFVFMPLLNVITIGLLSPLIHQLTVQFNIGNHRYGTARAQFHGTAGPFYGMYFMFVVLGFVWLFLIALLLGALVSFELLFTGLLYGAMLLPVAYLKAMTANLTYGNATLDRHKFRSNQEPFPLFGIYVTNIVAILVSVGLLVPWAKVRLARYRANCLMLRPDGDLVVLADKELAEQGAIGEVAADFGDFDFGL